MAVERYACATDIFFTAALVAARSSLNALSMLTNEVLSPFVMFALFEETLSTLSVTCLFKREIEVSA